MTCSESKPPPQLKDELRQSVQDGTAAKKRNAALGPGFLEGSESALKVGGVGVGWSSPLATRV